MIDKEYPLIHYYDQDFVDIYEKSWAWIDNCWLKGNADNGFQKQYFNYFDNKILNQFDTCFSTFFLVYSNNLYPAINQLDTFYSKQEANGAIRGEYNVSDGKPVVTESNPESIMAPLFAWSEYNLYHKVGLKKRIKEIMPKLERYYAWVEETFMEENGLYHVPLEATMMVNSPRDNMYYPIDFNSQQALNALYMSALGDILNDKEINFKYKKKFFSLKTRINSMMWDSEDKFYYDLDKNDNYVKVKTIASFWPLIAEIPNEERAEDLIEHLTNQKEFASENPFPTLSMDDPHFDKKGKGFLGSVYPPFTFMVIKGLEKSSQYGFARECAIRHMYFILDTLHPEGDKKGATWEAYAPLNDGPAQWEENENFPRKQYIPYVALSTIALMIENVVGLYISLPRKTVDWIVPTLELMGIENLSLKRNMITILSKKSNRGWEIRLESEKLYYFTIDIIGKTKKTLPIPSGKCSMLIDKL